MKSLRKKLEGRYEERPCIYPELSNCHIWNGASDASKYGVVSVCGHPTPAHRVSWVAANGPIPQGRIICHHCDTPACINPDHLYAGTHVDNWNDAQRRGRLIVRRGMEKTNARCTDDDIREIRTLAASGIARETLAHRFNVSKCSIGYIIRGVSWRHVSSGDDLQRLNLTQGKMLLKWKRKNNPVTLPLTPPRRNKP